MNRHIILEAGYSSHPVVYPTKSGRKNINKLGSQKWEVYFTYQCTIESVLLSMFLTLWHWPLIFWSQNFAGSCICQGEIFLLTCIALIHFNIFLQVVSIACYAEPCISYGWVVRLSVYLSVTRWHWVKTMQARITKSSLRDSPRTLVLGLKRSSRNSKGFTPSEGVNWEWGRKHSQFSVNNSPYLRNGAKWDKSYY